MVSVNVGVQTGFGYNELKRKRASSETLFDDYNSVQREGPVYGPEPFPDIYGQAGLDKYTTSPSTMLLDDFSTSELPESTSTDTYATSRLPNDPGYMIQTHTEESVYVRQFPQQVKTTSVSWLQSALVENSDRRNAARQSTDISTRRTSRSSTRSPRRPRLWYAVRKWKEHLIVSTMYTKTK